ncbi:hypothetical protein [Lachnoclostridium sp. Marseille-P6806]|uniref:hypothetical protein n=1 Tax=Lachnoclostridium sp. Marseille-P6806 TaxID=2364793 RepID=UPI00102FE1B1|nr:hypothetical protein [Lachnoclostridium sp. Marseille-P6806]
MNTELFLPFIANILNVRTWLLSEDLKAHAAFQKECCFESTLQPMYTSDYLSFLQENTAKNTFYEITDYLKTSLVLFQFEGTFYAIGPYVKAAFSQHCNLKFYVIGRLRACPARSLSSSGLRKL